MLQSFKSCLHNYKIKNVHAGGDTLSQNVNNLVKIMIFLIYWVVPMIHSILPQMPWKSTVNEDEWV